MIENDRTCSSELVCVGLSSFCSPFPKVVLGLGWAPRFTPHQHARKQAYHRKVRSSRSRLHTVFFLTLKNNIWKTNAGKSGELHDLKKSWNKGQNHDLHHCSSKKVVGQKHDLFPPKMAQHVPSFQPGGFVKKAALVSVPNASFRCPRLVGSSFLPQDFSTKTSKKELPKIWVMRCHEFFSKIISPQIQTIYYFKCVFLGYHFLRTLRQSNRIRRRSPRRPGRSQIDQYLGRLNEWISERSYCCRFDS